MTELNKAGLIKTLKMKQDNLPKFRSGIVRNRRKTIFAANCLNKFKCDVRGATQILLFLFLTVLITACGGDKDKPDYSQNLPPHDSFFDTYLNQVEQDFAKQGVTVNFNLPIAFGELNGRTPSLVFPSTSNLLFSGGGICAIAFP